MKLVYTYIYLCGTSTHVYYTFVVLVSNLKSNTSIFSPFCVFILQVLQTRIVIFKLKFVYNI